MTLRKTITGLVLTLLLSMSVTTAEAGAIAKAAARGAARSVAKSVNKGLAQKLSQDLVRDRKTAVHFLKRDSRAFRYTTKAQAQKELRSGLRPGTHMTVKANAGRSLGAASAQQRFGLAEKPQVRETIHLSKGQPIRRNRVLGGERGVGEMTSSKHVLPDSIEKVLPLR